MASDANSSPDEHEEDVKEWIRIINLGGYLDRIAACGYDSMRAFADASEEDIKELEKDPSQAPLEDNERAMLTFVIKAIKAADAVTQQDVDQLREMGWADRDILDALEHGTNMIGSSILMKTFKMDMTC